MGLNEKPSPVTVDITTASEEQTPQPTPEIEQQTSSSPSPSPPNSRWRRIIGIVWDTFDGSPQERRYVRKLDTFLLSYMCLAYFIKQLDQTNISNAFVSGMQEDLALYGNERNWLNTWFNIGILLGTIPSQLIQVEHVRPSEYICHFYFLLLEKKRSAGCCCWLMMIGVKFRYLASEL